MNQHHSFSEQLAAYMTDDPSYTYFARLPDSSLAGVGIWKGDIVVVDCSRDAKPGDIILGIVHGIRIIRIWEPGVLIAVNKTRTEEPITDQMDFKILGVVLSIIRRICP
jgi:DNA polymerase V